MNNFDDELGNPNEDMHFSVEAWHINSKAWRRIKVHAESRLRAVRTIYDNGYDNIGEMDEIR